MVRGPGALSHLDRLTTAARLPSRSPGECAYTLALNDRGGVEAEFVVARAGEDEFYLTVGTAVTKRVLRLLERGRPDGVEVVDVTDDFGIISVQGPEARDILGSHDVFQDGGFLDELKFSRFVTARTASGVEVRVFRLTYVGEVGYELHVAKGECQEVMQALLKAR